MNLRKLILAIVLVGVNTGWSWEKAQFDLDNAPKNQKVRTLNSLGFELHRTISEATLIHGGYFTLGTHYGSDNSDLDNRCTLSFGHPYALTSFPILAIDSTWGLPEDFFDVYAHPPRIQGDSLIAEYFLTDSIYFKFALILPGNGETIIAQIEIMNWGRQSHEFGTGIIFDPGLGNYEEGWLEINQIPILQKQMLTGDAIPQQLQLKERLGGSAGLMFDVVWPESTPNALLIANWYDLYRQFPLNHLPAGVSELYDLAFAWRWEHLHLAPQEKIIKKVEFQIKAPDFSGDAFVRWKIPHFLSIENGLLFPGQVKSLAEISNLSQQNQTDCSVDLVLQDNFCWINPSASFSLPAEGTYFMPIEIGTDEYYEDKVITLKLRVKTNQIVVDSLITKMFVPQIPYSDSGLRCEIDTIQTHHFPEVTVSFNGYREATQTKINQLLPKNIFLYENSQRISNFELGKAYSGGSDAIDVVFIIDCSGSMGNDIEAVRKNVAEFCQNLVINGYDYHLGLVVFSDHVHVLSDLTADVEHIRNQLAQVNLYGGRENSLGGIYQATQLSLRPQSQRTFIWITDEDYPVTPEINLSVPDVVNRLLETGVVLHSISEPSLQTNWCNPLIQPTGGKFYSIHGNFRDILLDISNARVFKNFELTYTSPYPNEKQNHVRLELHYAGLGGAGEQTYTPDSPPGLRLTDNLQCFPNPFNPSIHIQTNLPDNMHGKVEIFNILGQRVQSYALEMNQPVRSIRWNARDVYGQEVAGGNYFIQLTLLDKTGQLHKRELRKVLYLK